MRVSYGTSVEPEDGPGDPYLGESQAIPDSSRDPLVSQARGVKAVSGSSRKTRCAISQGWRVRQGKGRGRVTHAGERASIGTTERLRADGGW